MGDPVAAIGSPFGEEQSLSVGVISALDRDIESLTDFGIGDAIQTDAAINHGNSGGPLLDAHGRVIGINAQIESTGGGGEGVGFAIPVDTVRRSLEELREKGRSTTAISASRRTTLYPQLADRLGLDVETARSWAEVRGRQPARTRRASARGRQADRVPGHRDDPRRRRRDLQVDGQPLTRTTTWPTSSASRARARR